MSTEKRPSYTVRQVKSRWERRAEQMAALDTTQHANQLNVQLKSYIAEYLQRLCMNKMRKLATEQKFAFKWENLENGGISLKLSGDSDLHPIKMVIDSFTAGVRRFNPPIHIPKADTDHTFKVTNLCRILEKQYGLMAHVDEVDSLLRLRIVADHILKYEMVHKRVFALQSRRYEQKLALPQASFARFQELKAGDPQLMPTLKERYSIISCRAVKKKLVVIGVNTAKMEALALEIAHLVDSGTLLSADEAEANIQQQNKVLGQDARALPSESYRIVEEKAPVFDLGSIAEEDEEQEEKVQSKSEESARMVRTYRTLRKDELAAMLQKVQHDLAETEHKAPSQPLPDGWEDMSGLPAVSILLNPTSAEYKSVLTNIDNAEDIKVISVERVQNLHQWSTFQRKLAGQPTQLRWVGTGGIDPEEVVESKEGLDSFEFWKNSSRCNTFAYDKFSHGRQLFLATVVVPADAETAMVLKRSPTSYPSYLLTYQQ